MVGDISTSPKLPAKYKFNPTAFHRSLSNEMLKESVLWSFEWNSDDHWPSANEALMVLLERQPDGLDNWLRNEYFNIPDGGVHRGLVFEYAGSRISRDPEWTAWLSEIIEAPETEPYIRNDALKHFIENQEYNSQADLLLRMLPRICHYGSDEIFLRISDYVESSKAFWNVLDQIASGEYTDSEFPTAPRGLAIAAMGSLFPREAKTLTRIVELIEMKPEDTEFYIDAFTGLACVGPSDSELPWIHQQADKLSREKKTPGLIPLIKNFPEDPTIREAIFSGASYYADWPYHQRMVIEAMAENYAGHTETRLTLDAIANQKDRCGEIDTMPVVQPCIQGVALEQLAKKFPSKETFRILSNHISSEDCRIHSVVAKCLLRSYPANSETLELVNQMVTDGKLRPSDYRFWGEIAEMATQNILIETGCLKTSGPNRKQIIRLY